MGECILNITLLVSRTASDEIRQNDGGLCSCRGIAIFAEALGMREREWGKVLQPRFCLICSAKAMCGKEAFLLTSLFGYFCGYKSDKAPRQLSGTIISFTTKYLL